MEYVTVTNLQNGAARTLAYAVLAQTMWTRLRGLLGRRELTQGEGLLLVPCNGVHTLGMRFAIDVVFLSESGAVIHCVENLRPGRWVRAPGARMTLELRAGSVRAAALKQGDRLQLQRSVGAASGVVGRQV